ncbi:sortase-associated OmpA-like protein PdsO [Alteromonas sp. H39]|uniref:sortase-associated OmpA-like protein PdsO n=1 Tax=Alteromonas sp. H39 TaxID=3389876 RepID=UPI0039DFB455
MMTHFNKKSFATAAVLTALLSAPVSAKSERDDEADRSAAIGMGSGVIIGAVVAGPVGAAVAGVIGAMIGNDQVQEKRLDESRQALAKSQQALNDSQQALFAMHDELSAMQKEARITRVNYQAETTEKVLAIESSVQFKTGSVTIEPTYHTQLDKIADALARHDKLTVRLTGHADNRGDAAFNQALSMQRALSVKKYLTAKGVKSEQVFTVAMGEEKSAGQSYEETFFDRRVVMQISEDSNTLTAKR